jgi:Kef-type K+ transport system membrane component KefB
MNAEMLITVGSLLILGLFTDFIGTRLFLPRVTLLILFGILIGPSFLNFIPDQIMDVFPTITAIALGMVGFILGGSLDARSLNTQGSIVFAVSIAVTLLTVLFVAFGLTSFGSTLPAALALAGISASTDPATTLEVIREGKCTGSFSKVLKEIVIIDDIWAVMTFSTCLFIANSYSGAVGDLSIWSHILREIIGSILLGVFLGIPTAYLSGRLRPGEPTLLEILGVVFLCCGIASWLNLSYLLASMTLGCVVVNLATHHLRPFHTIENIEQPFMVIFFVLAGAVLEIESLFTVWWIAFVYILARFVGRVSGAFLGAKLSGAPILMRRWMGTALLPQAGISIGMTLYAVEQLPDFASIILPTAVASIVFFELFGPILTRYSLKKSGEYRTRA